MEKEEKAILWLSMFDFVGVKKALNLINEYGSAVEVLNNVEKLKDLFKVGDFEKLKIASDFNYLDNFINNCEKQNIKIVTYKSSDYPKSLLDIDTKPLVLYCKGNIKLLNENGIAIVGTRRITKYGTEVTTKFTTALAKAGLVIVSGLSYGVDACAHETCLKVKGKTIAVLGCGLNEIYPATNIPLAEKIIENDGLVISEYKPNEKPKTYYFPIRNRIISGLSKGVLIPEATLKSGSMHTKNYALEYGKELYVVPGRVTDIYSFGCNSIIKSLQGCMVLTPEDILSDFNLKYKEENICNIQISIDEQLILSILNCDELHYEEILNKSGLDAKTLNTILVKLEMKKLIKKLPGNFYCK